MQGYLISEPMPVADLEMLLRDAHRAAAIYDAHRPHAALAGRRVVMQWVGNLSLGAKLRFIVVYAARSRLLIARCCMYRRGSR